MRKLYIVEGPDAAGKTSITTELLRRGEYRTPNVSKTFWRKPSNEAAVPFFKRRAIEYDQLVTAELTQGDDELSEYLTLIAPKVRRNST
ncbi:MAG: thymidylate kinase [Candidatus Woesearchaeota archaeon]|jgi:thymidylate kinase